MHRPIQTLSRPMGAGRAALCGVAMCLALAAPVRADLVEDAVEALQIGDADRSLALSEAILARQPDHVDALIIKARALSLMGRAREARAAASAAYDAAASEPTRYAAAMFTAELSARDENYMMAQFWLRRAVQHSESDAQTQRVAQAYRVARTKSRWRFQFSAGIAPNSNINNGSSEQIIMINGLPFLLSATAQSLSGMTAEAEAVVFFRFAESATSQSLVDFVAAGRMNWLDAGSQSAAPGVSGHDYDFYAVGLGLRHLQRFELGQLDLGAKALRNWYGGAHFADVGIATASFSLPVDSAGTTLSFGGGVQHVRHHTAGLSDETSWTLNAGLSHELAWGDGVKLGLSYSQNYSSNAAQEYSLPQVRFEYDMARPIADTYLSFGGSYGYKSFDVSPYTTTGRQDHIVSVQGAAEFREINWMGFSPVATVRLSRSWSNVSLYSQQSISGGISLRSRF